jgi:hypothetical protein
MSSSVSITTALCLAASDVETLIQGRMVAAISRTFINAIPQFAICPADISDDEQTVKIQAWARLESCKIFSDLAEVEKLAQLTVWSSQNLQNLLQERNKIFLAYLRVYRLPQPIEISSEHINTDKIGSFIRMPSLLTATVANPVLNDALFHQRYQQLIKLEVPQHPELEKLHSDLIKLNSPNQLEAKFLDDLNTFLGWSSPLKEAQLDPDLAWIKTITTTGNSSDGDTFEKLVRRSLIKLGFSNSLNNIKASLDPEATGGAGGIDVYCDAPFPLVGECKASKHETVPNGVSAQLIQLGNTYLGKQQFEQSIKVIFASGSLTNHAEKAAIENHINVMRPQTLQRLVELKAKHPGSVNLIELQPCLEEPPFGENADSKVNAFINAVWQQIKVRSNIVQAVKYLNEVEQNQIQVEVADIKAEYNAKLADQCDRLTNQEVYEILLELSSPLAGYVGRIQGTGLSSDRFYFLRELQVD